MRKFFLKRRVVARMDMGALTIGECIAIRLSQRERTFVESREDELLFIVVKGDIADRENARQRGFVIAGVDRNTPGTRFERPPRDRAQIGHEAEQGDQLVEVKVALAVERFYSGSGQLLVRLMQCVERAD